MGRAISSSNVWWKKIVMALWAQVFKAYTKQGDISHIATHRKFQDFYQLYI